eukprot:625835_1
MRDMRCYWQRCPARTYYSAWRSHRNETKNDNIVFQIEYQQVFTMMFHLFVDVCDNMERMDGNGTVGHLLLHLNELYKPWDRWHLSVRGNRIVFWKSILSKTRNNTAAD